MSIQMVTGKNVNFTSQLTRNDEEKLFHRYREQGDLTARDEIIESQASLVNAISRKYYQQHLKIEFSDLVQTGVVGLLHATDKFDPKRGVRFGAYARYWVNREILALVRKSQHMAHVPQTYQREQVLAWIFKHGDNSIGVSELAEKIHEETGTSMEIIKDMIIVALTRDISLSSQVIAAKHNITPDDGAELVDIIPSKDPTPEEQCLDNEVAQIIHDAVSTLKEVEQRVITGKYFKDKSNQEISNEINRGVVSMLNLELKTRKKLGKLLSHLKNAR